MHYGKIKLDNGEEVLFEIDQDYYGDVANNKRDVIIQFESIMKSIKYIAENAHTGMRNINDDARPDSYEISFGMKFSVDAGVVFARVCSEANLLVKLNWMAEK